mgnify:CR=1 FL=1
MGPVYEGGDGTEIVYISDGEREISYISLYNGGRIIGILRFT